MPEHSNSAGENMSVVGMMEMQQPENSPHAYAHRLCQRRALSESKFVAQHISSYIGQS